MLEQSNIKHPLHPPGGLMIWLLILMELIVFGATFLAFFFVRGQELKLFAEAQQSLNPTLGFINTILLITSGGFVALGNRLYEEKANKLSALLFVGGIVFGIAFLGVKGIEYSHKVSLGHTTGVNAFFDFYWLLTVFHAAHVLLGLLVLFYITYRIKYSLAFDPEGVTVKMGSAFWHMCDLVWVLLFPILYLI